MRRWKTVLLWASTSGSYHRHGSEGEGQRYSVRDWVGGEGGKTGTQVTVGFGRCSESLGLYQLFLDSNSSQALVSKSVIARLHSPEDRAWVLLPRSFGRYPESLNCRLIPCEV